MRSATSKKGSFFFISRVKEDLEVIVLELILVNRCFLVVAHCVGYTRWMRKMEALQVLYNLCRSQPLPA